MGLSVWQIALVAVLFLLLFGRGKIPQLMGDLADGIKSFKKGVADDSDEKEEPASVHLKQSEAETDKVTR